MRSFTLYIPIFIIVGGNVLYHISAKSVPDHLNPFVSLVAAYSLATLVSLVLFFLTSPDKHLGAAAAQIDKTAIFLSLAMVAMEVGTILLYRSGWDVSVGPLISNISVAVALLFVGILFFHEHLTLTQAAGVACCLIGVLLIHKK